MSEAKQYIPPEAGFKCPRCGRRCFGTVTDSRPRDGYRYRLRQCEFCGKHFSTREIVAPIQEYHHPWND